MDRAKLLKLVGLVVAFFILGQAARNVAGGDLVFAAIEAFIAVFVLVAVFRL